MHPSFSVLLCLEIIFRTLLFKVKYYGSDKHIEDIFMYPERYL